MKLNIRFLLTTFFIVLIISISSTFIFYSLVNKLLVDQQSKTLKNAATNLAFSFQTELQKTDEEFRKLIPKLNNFRSIELDSTNIDYIFTLVNDSLINTKEFKVRSNSYLNIRTSSFQKFFTENQASYLRYAQLKDGKTFYYGRVISEQLLNNFRDKINAEVALVVNDAQIEVSMPENNQTRLTSILSSANELKRKNNFDIYTEELSDADFVAILYSPKLVSVPQLRVSFIVFEAFEEGVEFRNTLQIVMLLIVLAGTAITFIIVLVSTTKLRKQIDALSKAAEETGAGNLDHRVPIISKDEIGHFGETFNKMMDELVKKKKAEKEYSEFLALINQNPTLKEIADAALRNILKSTNLTFGALYLIENINLRLISSYGIGKYSFKLEDLDFINDAMEKREVVELSFQDNYPEVKTNTTSVKIKYLVVYPVIYNKEVVAVLKLACESKPTINIKEFINTIHEQLAVGLVNAKSFEQLENLVVELKKLNEEYQKQNKQIVEQNDELRTLHNQLKEKAAELVKQKEKALELTKVKSDFLASMSHELRTPLISILGLTELMLKDSGVVIKVKDRLGIVNRNGKKLLGLINNILEFSKFESGKIDIKKETCILNDLVEEIKSNVFQLAFEKNLKLVFALPENETIILNTDKNKLEQIILNLIVNAIKFTDSGFIEIKCDVRNQTDLFFEVVDTGIGISEEDQKLIFKEFKQVDGSTSRKYNGAGLGLAICKKYVELLGGALTLKSKIGKGSSFSFILQDSVLEASINKEHKFLTIDSLTENQEQNQSVKLPVLLITDSPATKNIIRDYLTSYSIFCESSNTFIDAEKLIKNKIYSAIIINPTEQSFSFITKIKSIKNNNTTPIIIVKIFEEHQYGWQPNIYDYVVATDYEKDLHKTIDNISMRTNRNISTALIITQLIKDDTSATFSTGNTVINRVAINEITETNKFTKTDIIFIDVDSIKERSFELCYMINSGKELKECLIVFILPNILDEKVAENLVVEYERIGSKVKMHPLDILKVIRDRLNLANNSKRNNELIIEEKTETVVELEKKKTKKSKPTILIVDDDDDALFTVGEYVKELDYDTIFAHNGMECLLMLNHVIPDLIFLDIMMPQMDGFETIKRIRSENRFSKLPVVALTAYAMLDNQNVIEKNGFNDLITKPIDFQLLASKITKYLHK